MFFTVLFYHLYLSARPWLRDDLDTWIERSKVRPFFHSFVLSFVVGSFVRSFVLLSLVSSLVLPSLIRSYACPSDLSYIYSRDKKNYNLPCFSLQGPPHKLAVIFVDNSGVDIILGMFPFVRELLSRGTKVPLLY